MTQQFNEDYFMRGQELGVSSYTDYRWMPELTIPMVASIVSHLHIAPDDTILDFGCARGYVVKAFRTLGYDAWGMDTSEWAIANCDPVVKDFVFTPGEMPRFTPRVRWVITKDVLEHVESVADVIIQLMDSAIVGMFAVVPLAGADGYSYVVAEYEKDVTHIHRLTLASWARLFMRPGWSVEASYRVRGVKDNYAQHTAGNGFITARRLK